jgi:hypothetical protein
MVVLLLPMLAFACIVADPGPMATLGVWLAWMVLALGIDAVSPRVGRTRNAAGSTTKALLFTAPLLQGAVLVYALWIVSATAKAPISIAMIAVMVGISGGSVGISAARELVHRRGSLERGIAGLHAARLVSAFPDRALARAPSICRNAARPRHHAAQRTTCPLCRPRLRARLAQRLARGALEAGT